MDPYGAYQDTIAHLLLELANERFLILERLERQVIVFHGDKNTEDKDQCKPVYAQKRRAGCTAPVAICARNSYSFGYRYSTGLYSRLYSKHLQKQLFYTDSTVEDAHIKTVLFLLSTVEENLSVDWNALQLELL